MVKGRKDNRIRLRPDVDRSLDYYISEQTADITGIPGARLDRNTVISDIAQEFLTTAGHYPPDKTGE